MLRSMRAAWLRALLLLVMSCWIPAAWAACEKEDFETRISGEEQCLVMRRFGALQPNTMVVWLHGDGNGGYHIPVAEKAAADFAEEKVLSIALVRPGYSDGAGGTSSVSPQQSGRSDHYTKVNIAEVGSAIERLRNHYRPGRVILAAHSGGAATSAILLGLKPDLAVAALLVSCPCELVAWRAGRRPWSLSENPTKWIDRIPATTRVIALTGEKDDNTFPSLGKNYSDALAARSLKAEFQLVSGANHNGAFQSPMVTDALRDLLKK